MKTLSAKQSKHFHRRVLDWFELHGRKNLPWQQPATPYRVWVSEVMLQQTQVETVIPYFNKFINTFPTIEILANADLNQVLHLWSGLGYYARARNLHKSATIINSEFKNELPNTLNSLQLLPGIGRSTAGAICSLGFKENAAILDGNVKRVLARHYCVEGWPGKSTVLKQLWEISERLTPQLSSAKYNQAMMDLGSLICRRSKPLCEKCPINSTCQAKKHQQILLYPGKKPSKVIPIKTDTFYLITNNQNNLFLHQRPPVGIWGGLWCLPNNQQLSDANIKITEAHEISNFTHKFSHFTLQATIKLAKIQLPDEVMDATNWNWYDLHNPDKVGMPAPLITVLNEFKENLS